MSPRKRAVLGVLVAVVIAAVLVTVLGSRTSQPDTRAPGQLTDAQAEPPTAERPPSDSEAQPSTDDTQSKRDPAATVRVEGVVVDSLGGPIEGAQLTARQKADRDALPIAFAQSDEHGRFTLWVRPGPVREHAALLWIHARAHGYAEATVAVRTPARSVRMSLFPESRLAGVVVTEAGDPVSGVTVELRPPPLSLLPIALRTQTDAEGRFELRNLAPGRYLPFVDDGQWFGKLERIELGLLEHRDDLRLVVTAGHEVRVDVRAPDRSRCLAPRAWIRGLERHSQRDADGLVTLAAVPSGEHRLIGACEGALEADLTVEITDDASFTITTIEGQAITGRVLDERGDPIAGARVIADPPRAGHAHALHAADSDDRGEFELPGLPPGRFQVHASRSDRLGTEPVSVQLQPGASPPYIELRLERGQCLRGRVEGGPDPLIVVAVADQRTVTNLQLPADREFEICGFAPSSESTLMLEDPGARVRVPFVSDATTVERLELQFPEAGERELDLRIEATADRSLRVTTEGEAIVELVPWDEPPPAESPTCKGRPFPVEVIALGVTEDGDLSFENLWPGYYNVHVDQDGEHRCVIVDVRSDVSTVSLVD